MRFELTPHVGAGDIKLGMSRMDIRAILGRPEYATGKSIVEVEESAMSSSAIDAYFENELQITFDDNGAANFIEFSGRSAEHTTVFFKELNVFRMPAMDLIRSISEITKTEFDKEEEEIPYAYVFHELDLAVWRPVIPEQDETENIIPESDEGKYFWTIAIGIEGYYKKD